MINSLDNNRIKFRFSNFQMNWLDTIKSPSLFKMSNLTAINWTEDSDNRITLTVIFPLANSFASLSTLTVVPFRQLNWQIPSLVSPFPACFLLSNVLQSSSISFPMPSSLNTEFNQYKLLPCIQAYSLIQSCYILSWIGIKLLRRIK